MDTHLRIRHALLDTGGSFAAIARTEGVTRTFVMRVAKNDRVSARIRRAIAAECGIPVRELWPDWGKPQRRGRYCSSHATTARG